MLEYTFILFKDSYTLSNTSEENSLSYSLQKLDNCFDYTIINSGVIDSTGLPVSFDLDDGNYKLILTQGEETLTLNFKYYLELQKSLIKSIDEVICGCECTECEDCNDCENNLLTLLKLNSYLSLTDNGDTINENYSIISQEFLCNLSTDVECNITQEKILGTSNTESLLKNIISLHYLVLYFTEVNIGTSEETDYIREKYNFNSLSKCIKNLGINLSTIEELTS